MKSVVIIYGSTGGNTEIVCRKVAEVLGIGGIIATLHRVEQSRVEHILCGSVCILAAPTYEHGIIQHHFLTFLEQLKSFDLKNHPMTVIGLGDPNYDTHYHIESANTLVSAIKKSNGYLVYPPLRVSGLPFPSLENRVTKWAQTLARKVKAL